MAKILFFNIPAHGHVNATLPVVAELARRGHEVLYYCGEGFQKAIEKTGASFRAYPHPEMKGLSAKIATAIARNMANIAPLLLNTAEIVTPFALEEIEREKPDLVMHDSVTLWGHLAARASGIPNVVTYSNLASEGIKLEIDWRVMVRFALGALSRIPAIMLSSRRLNKRYGLTLPFFPTKGVKNLVFMAREFHPHTPFVDDSFVFVGPSIDPAMREENTWETIETTKPLVYISLGTINNQNLAFYRAVFTAFADYPAQFLMSVGRAQNLTDVPPNFIIKNSVPQLQVLQQTHVFITHGGMNSVQEGLYYGVPEIVVPQQIEQLFNGVQVAKLGVGVLLPLGQVKHQALRGALDRILRDPCYREAAARLKQVSRSAGGYQKAAEEVERMFSLAHQSH